MPFLAPVVAFVGANAGAIAAVASVGLSVASGIQQANAQKAQAKIAQQTAEYNAKLQENQAIQQDMEDREGIRRLRAQNEKLKGEQRAVLGASGVTTAGSPLEVLGETAGLMELDILDKSRAAELARRRGFAEAAMTRASGANLAAGYKSQATGTLLSTGASAFSQIGGGIKSGAFKFVKPGG